MFIKVILRLISSFVMYGVKLTRILIWWVPEDALFQVLQWQNTRVLAFPSKMTMVLRFVAQ